MEDSFIVLQTKNGNTQAFKILVLRYQKPIFRYLQSFGLRREIIEELAQECFIRAYKNLSDYDPEKASFSTWLFVIAKNLTLNELSRHSYKKEEFPELLPELTEHHTPFTLFEKEQLSQNIHKLLTGIPPQFRNSLTLFHLNEMSLEEISQIEGCSVGTVKSRIFRAKEMLKQLIKINLKEGL